MHGGLRSPSAFDNASEAPSIALDATHLYWTNEAASTIGRAKLGPGETLEEVKQDFIKDAGHPLGLALDATHLFWTANQNFPPNPGNDLYRFETETGELSDLTKGAPGPNGAEVKGVLGISSDGSYVYFVANGVLAPGAAAGDCKGFTSARASPSAASAASTWPMRTSRSPSSRGWRRATARGTGSPTGW